MSEEAGLVHCFRAGLAEELDWDALRAWRPGDGLLWIHLDAHAEETRRFVEAELGATAAEALLAEDTRPRMTPMDGGLLLNLRGVNLNPGADPEDMVSVRMWIEPTRVVTTRRRRVMAGEDLATRFRTGRAPRTAGELVAWLADRLEVRIDGALETLSERLDDAEESSFARGDASPRSTTLAEIRREAVILRRYLGPQRAALEALAREESDAFSTEDRALLRELGDRTTRHVEDLEAIRERCAVAQEEDSQRLAAELNQRIYALSVIAGLFLPLSFATGLLGINVAGIPGADTPAAFALVCAGLLGVVALEVLIFRWLRWI